MGVARHSIATLTGVLLAAVAAGGQSSAATDAKRVEGAILAVNAEMTKAAEAVDAEQLFSFMLDTERCSVIQNGMMMATREEALRRVRGNLSDISKIRYVWKSQHVTVLSAEVALLTAEGESTATTTAGATFTTPFAQTVVFVLKEGSWKAIHAHQSSPRAP